MKKRVAQGRSRGGRQGQVAGGRCCPPCPSSPRRVGPPARRRHAPASHPGCVSCARGCRCARPRGPECSHRLQGRVQLAVSQQPTAAAGMQAAAGGLSGRGSSRPSPSRALFTTPTPPSGLIARFSGSSVCRPTMTCRQAGRPRGGQAPVVGSRAAGLLAAVATAACAAFCSLVATCLARKGARACLTSPGRSTHFP